MRQINSWPPSRFCEEDDTGTSYFLSSVLVPLSVTEVFAYLRQFDLMFSLGIFFFFSFLFWVLRCFDSCDFLGFLPLINSKTGFPLKQNIPICRQITFVWFSSGESFWRSTVFTLGGNQLKISNPVHHWHSKIQSVVVIGITKKNEAICQWFVCPIRDKIYCSVLLFNMWFKTI